MSKHAGPEEFFEALRSARRERLPRWMVAKPEQKNGAAQEPAEQEPNINGTAPAVEQPPASPDASDPVIRLRRSTFIFALIMAIVLLFIAYAIGRRAHGQTPPPALQVTERPADIQEVRPLLPSELLGKSAIFLKEFDHTQNASRANAIAYCKYLNDTPDSAFIAEIGKRSFVLSIADQRKLVVCVGPFDALAGPEIDAMLPRMRELRFNGVKPFRAAYAATLPPTARICE